ncbi:conserved hypothetical protein [Paraburkholderia caribensis]|nr:conserved hypothetical protein [Paraburkholderia caribensis]
MIWPRRSFDAKIDGRGQADLGGDLWAVVAGIGLRGQWTIETDGCRGWQPYGSVNQSRRECSGGVNTRFGSDPFHPREDATRIRVAGGVTTLRSPYSSTYAQAGYRPWWAMPTVEEVEACRVILSFVKRVGQKLSSPCTCADGTPRFPGHAVLLEVVSDKLPHNLGWCQVLCGAEFLERFFFYGVNQDCQSGAFRFHGGSEGWNMLIKL